MKIEVVVAAILAGIGILAKLLKNQSSVDLDKKEDLKELHSMSDLFMFH